MTPIPSELVYTLDSILHDVQKPGYESVLGQASNCVSVSVFAARLLTRQGISATPIEAVALLIPDHTKSHASAIGDPELVESGNKSSWSGHMVIHVPRWGEIVDLSLGFLGNPVMWQMMSDDGRDPNNPICLTVTYNALMVGPPQTRLGNGLVRWHLYPNAQEWKELEWDYTAIENLADNYFKAK